MKTLRFRARGTALVTNFAHLEGGKKSFVGRKFVEVEPGNWGFAPTGEDHELPYAAEYVKACADGDLWPADQATADACGVKFDSTFGEPALAKKPAASPAEKG
jgi:hypothetical protein